jgi:uncharacterized protein YeaO (DUF488 family)
MGTQPTVRVGRVYEEPDPADGVRILVDRLWPRGVREQDLAHDARLKDVAPSGDLRTWYGHRPERFEGFARRYPRSSNRAHRPVLSFGGTWSRDGTDDLIELPGDGTLQGVVSVSGTRGSVVSP